MRTWRDCLDIVSKADFVFVIPLIWYEWWIVILRSILTQGDYKRPADFSFISYCLWSQRCKSLDIEIYRPWLWVRLNSRKRPSCKKRFQRQRVFSCKAKTQGLAVVSERKGYSLSWGIKDLKLSIVRDLQIVKPRLRITNWFKVKTSKLDSCTYFDNLFRHKSITRQEMANSTKSEGSLHEQTPSELFRRPYTQNCAKRCTFHRAMRKNRSK